MESENSNRFFKHISNSSQCNLVLEDKKIKELEQEIIIKKEQSLSIQSKNEKLLLDINEFKKNSEIFEKKIYMKQKISYSKIDEEVKPLFDTFDILKVLLF